MVLVLECILLKHSFSSWTDIKKLIKVPTVHLSQYRWPLLIRHKCYLLLFLQQHIHCKLLFMKTHCVIVKLPSPHCVASKQNNRCRMKSVWGGAVVLVVGVHNKDVIEVLPFDLSGTVLRDFLLEPKCFLITTWMAFRKCLKKKCMKWAVVIVLYIHHMYRS